MNSNLLKEAIADAKAVREVAIANAKLALEEAFAPKLKSMLSAKIQNEVEDVDDEQVDEVPFEDAGKEEFGAEPSGEEFGGEPSGEEFGGEPEVEAGFEGAVSDQEPEMKDDAGCEPDEFSLDEILKEFDEEENEDVSAPVDEVNEEEVKYEDGEEDKEEEVDLQELINELKNEFEGIENLDEKKCPCECKKEKEKMKKDLDEHIQVVKFLKSKINEVNLLNAKLLFTNKLFKDNSLSESQKLNIVETLDRANSIREIKLVYSTLSESFNILKRNNKKEKVNRIHKITEGIASKTIGSTKPNTETIKQVINEGNDLANRFKKLAGIL